IRAIKIYQNTPLVKCISKVLSEAAEATGTGLGAVATILTDPSIFGLLRDLDSANPTSEKIAEAIGRIASYTKDLNSTVAAARFLPARRFSNALPELAGVLENAIFLARDPRSVRQILEGFTAGEIDVVLERLSGNKQAIASIRDIAWKTRNASSI